MMNKEIALGLKKIAEGLVQVADGYLNQPTTLNEAPTPKKVEVVEKQQAPIEVKHEPVKAPVEKVEPSKEVVEEKKEDTVEEKVNKAFLLAMNYNDLRKYAKEVGARTTGSKEIIADSILETLGVSPVEAEPQVKDEPSQSVNEAPSNEDETAENEDEEVEEDDNEPIEEGEETLYDKVASDLAGYTDEEIADILSDVGISPKGKRQALLAKVVTAIEEGKLEWEEEDEEPQEETSKTEAPQEDVKIDEDEIIEEDGDTIPGSHTRQVEWEKKYHEISSQIENGEISHKEIIAFLKDFYNNKYVSQGEESDIEEYVGIHCDLIDDEGNVHPVAEPYYVGDDIYCCGQPLVDIDDGCMCEICGQEYDVQ